MTTDGTTTGAAMARDPHGSGSQPPQPAPPRADPPPDQQKQSPNGGAPGDHPRDPATHKRILIAAIVVGVLVIILGTVWFLSWFLHGRYHVTTDDAYAGGDQVQVNALIAGTVRSIAVDDTDQVVAGQLLVELDASDADLEVASASASLGIAVRTVRQLQAEAERARAQAMLAELDVRRTVQDLHRRADASHEGTLSQEEVDHAEIAEAQSEASSEAARAAHAAVVAQVDGVDLTGNPQVAQAAARLRMALLAQQRARIVAPRPGMVARRLVQVGQRIQPGQPLLTLVALDRLWVDANFKESQLRGVEAGQMATVSADLYGSHVAYHARVEGLEAGTGAAFALLPAQNATGNWIKIVQRLPVRLSLDPEELRRHPLRIGLSLTVDIGIGRERRDTPATQANQRGRPMQLESPIGLSPDAEAVVTRIIEQHSALPHGAAVSERGLGIEESAAAPVPASDDIR